MARLSTIALLLLAAACALAQDIVDNPAPKNGDVCRDAGDQWRNIKLGPCEKGTVCQGYKRGEWHDLATQPTPRARQRPLAPVTASTYRASHARLQLA